MTDYTRNVDYAAKDALTVDDPLKLILGTEVQAELDEIVVAIASKFDSSDIATQAQAEAGDSNTTLITPLRLSQYLAGGEGGAGMLGDIISLADPNADRGLFWDDSAGAVALFSVGTGMQFSGTALNLVLASIDHDSLLNWTANKHIDHSTVSISTGSGLSGGGTIASTRTLVLDINGLTTDNSFDESVDYIPYYDAGETANNKVLVSSLIGVQLGDGKWYKNATQSLSAATDTTVATLTEVHDELTRGTFNTTAGTYTGGASGARILISAVATLASLSNGRTFELVIQLQSVDAARAYRRNDADSTVLTNASLEISTVLVVPSGHVVRVQVNSELAGTLTAGVEMNSISIVELA